MQVTVYGIILFVYIAIVFIKVRNSKKRFLKIFTLSIFLYTNITIGFVLKVGNQTIAGYFITTLFAAIAAIPILAKMELKRFIQMIMFISVVILALILIPYMDYIVVEQRGWDYYLFGANNLVISSLNSTHVKELIKAISFVVVLEAAYKCMTFEDWKIIINTIIRWSKVALCYGVFEFIAVYVFKVYNLYTIILQPIFGVKSSTYTQAISRGGGYQLQCLYTEPSAYAAGLFMIILMFIAQYRINRASGFNNNTRSMVIWITICGFLEVVAMSFSALLYMAALGVVAIVYLYKTKRKLRPIIWGGIFLVVIIVEGSDLGLVNIDSYRGARLSNVLTIIKTAIIDPDLGNLYFHVVGQADDGSSVSRIGSIIGSIRMQFVQNPFIGLGVGTANTHGLISNMLTDLGIFGTVLWMKMVIFVGRETYNKYFIFALLASLIVCVLCIPFNYLGTDVMLFIALLKMIFDVEHNNIRKDQFSA